jgi:integrase
LDETGAPMKVQQELMRHASIQTTMNVYEQAMPASKREANGESRGNGTQADESERLKH